MLEWPADFDPNFLVLAEVSAQLRRDELMHAALPHPHTNRRLRQMLADPFYRPLMELLENGATDYLSALALSARGFIRTDQMIARSGFYTDRAFEVVSVTDEGRHHLDRFLMFVDEYRELDPIDCEPHEIVAYAVACYMARDLGAGIVVTRNLAEVAVELEDGDVLRRLMSLHRFERQLSAPSPDIEDALELRAQTVEYWATRNTSGRRGFAIVDMQGPLVAFWNAQFAEAAAEGRP